MPRKGLRMPFLPLGAVFFLCSSSYEPPFSSDHIWDVVVEALPVVRGSYLYQKGIADGVGHCGECRVMG